MDLTFSEEQILLRDSAQGVLAAQKAKPAADFWAEMAKLGWLGLPLPEEHGGLAQSPVDTGILTEAFGRHLVVTPYVPVVVLCGRILARLGSPAQQAEILPALADGKTTLALAHAEENARHHLGHVATSARREGDRWRIKGRKVAAVGGDTSDILIVFARIAGAVRDESGIGLFLVERNHPGVATTPYAMLDGGSAASIDLDVTLSAEALLGGNENAFAFLDDAFDHAIAAWCSELVGMIETLLAATIDYTKMRVQFGKPLAVNQVLRHRMADMSIAAEEARSLALRAALSLADSDDTERARAVSGAWAKISRAARFVAEQAVQMHGGMGVTDELQIGQYLKRVMALEAIVGSPAHHLRRHAALSGRGRIAA